MLDCFPKQRDIMSLCLGKTLENELFSVNAKISPQAWTGTAGAPLSTTCLSTQRGCLKNQAASLLFY